MTILAAAIFFGLVTLIPTHAQELNVLGGTIESNHHDTEASAWQVEYREKLSDHTAFGISWANEGHLTNHHRDGFAVQFWGRLPAADDRFTLAAGLGPYLWCDTELFPATRTAHNTHALGAMLSLDAAWRLDDRWQVLARANWVGTESGFDTSSVNFGLGYLLGDATAPGAAPTTHSARPPVEELTVFLGQTHVNGARAVSFANESVEYRRGLGRNWEWSATLLNEDDRHVTRHEGLVGQVWAVRPLYDGRLTLGVGAGPYVLLDSRPLPKRPPAESLSAVCSATAAYAFSDRWLVRGTWNRLLTRDNTDADLVQLGLGYRFGGQ